jgi:hypothetical protein
MFVHNVGVLCGIRHNKDNTVTIVTRLRTGGLDDLGTRSRLPPWGSLVLAVSIAALGPTPASFPVCSGDAFLGGHTDPPRTSDALVKNAFIAYAGTTLCLWASVQNITFTC